ncbi:polyprenyl synthetase family protein [Stella sp.]|uniref:polyprenyl synthetase family protein n=1 Tax=Stella sp. TaxID=2912054 RepID=UPI0035AF3752
MAALAELAVAGPGSAQERIDDRLQALLGAGEDGELRRAMAEAALGGGRRLRATLTILACRAVGGRDADALDLACAVEMVHAASLVLDDLPAMDNAAERRGRPALHRGHGEAVAILAAVALLARAFEIAGAVDRARGTDAVERLARAVGAAGMCGGQRDDLAARRSGVGPRMDAAGLEALHRRKSGCLVSAACELGAMAGGGGAAARQALADYGTRLGIAYQIVDDVADRERDLAVSQPNYAAAVGAAAARDRAAALMADGARIAAAAGAEPAALEAFVGDLLALRPAAVAS